MNWELITSVGVPCVAAIASYVGSHLALKVHFEYLRRDVNRLETDIRENTQRITMLEGKVY